MRVRRILYSSKFLRSFKSLPLVLRPIVMERESIFRENIFDERLRTHKLKGVLKGYWSFSLTRAHRVLFELQEEGIVAFLDVGDHSIYR